MKAMIVYHLFRMFLFWYTGYIRHARYRNWICWKCCCFKFHCISSYLYVFFVVELEMICKTSLVITASFCLFSSRSTNWLHQQTKISFTTKTFVLIAFDWKREMLNVKLFFDRWFPNELSLSIQYLSITSGGRHVLNDYAKRNKKFSAGKKITMFVIILFIPLFEMWAEWKMFHILWHVFQFYDMWIVRSNKIILIGVFFSNWKFVHSELMIPKLKLEARANWIELKQFPCHECNEVDLKCNHI